MNYESIYPGALYTTLTPSYYTEPIANYQANIKELGMAMDARTANQLGELNTKINPGAKTMEVQGISAQTMESIPDQHLDEMNRLSKLTGVEPTLHGPMVEASGIGEGGFTEENRLGVENQIESAVMRSHKLDPKGNVSVTFHSTAQLPELRPHFMTGKPGEREKIEQGLFIVNEESGQITQIRPEKRYFPEDKKFTEKEIKFEAEKELERKNRETWTESVSQVNRMAEFGEQSLEQVKRQIMSAGPRISEENREDEIKKREEIAEKVINDVALAMENKLDLEKIKKQSPEYAELYDTTERGITHGQIYLRDAYRGMKTFFDKAWNNVKNEEDKQKLRDFAYKVKGKITKDFETDFERVEELKEVVNDGLRTLSDLNQTPEIFKPLDKFVIDKSAETFANVAESAYKKFGKTAPIINIENPPAGGGISTGEDLKKLVVASREQLTKNLTKKGISTSKAKQVAEQMIGATWDVGHINMLRKKGYTEKEIIEETKKIAPFVKHVHLSDNFGLDHTELPMGMGNVPLKPMKDALKKAGFKGKEIIEAGNWWQFFSEQGGGNPFKPSIEAFDSPIYSMKEGPGWANTGAYGSYFSGQGAINPPLHHNIYGAGFQTLPVELGGEIPGGDRGRFAGGGQQ